MYIHATTHSIHIVICAQARKWSVGVTVPSSYKITRIAEFLKGHEVLFDCSRADEPIKYADTSGLVVGTACPSPTKWLLTNYGACGFFVVINIPSGVA